MELVQRSTLEESAAPPKQEERVVYYCPMHRQEVFDKPGTCTKGACAGMKLEEKRLGPGAHMIFTCPMHPKVVSDKPGKCPECGMALEVKFLGDPVRLARRWICTDHPGEAAKDAGDCSTCGMGLKPRLTEEPLAVPFEAVIDTGERTVVFIDRGHGAYEAVEVVLGPRAGEYYPVLKGLVPGDRVVASGAFLLDAEARLNPAAGVAYFGASGGK